MTVWLGVSLASAELGGSVSFDARSHTLSVGAVKMRVRHSDITTEKADAIVNSTNESLDMTSGLYSSHLHHSFACCRHSFLV